MPSQRQWIAGVLAAVVLGLGRPMPVTGLDHVTLQRDGRPIQVAGRLLLTALDGGLMVQAPDGVIWLVQPDELVEHTTDDTAFKPLSSTELAQRLLEELPRGFNVLPTKRYEHYVICYGTSKAYAEWCASLFERLHMAFTNFWTRRGFKLSEPEFPLVAVVFPELISYADYAQPEVGEGVQGVIGYFSMRTNRMVMYDLTGAESLGRLGPRRNTSAQINQILRRPDAQRTVATIVHEATHQIAYNCGLHTRYGDCPRWFSEGIAVYFETPDLTSFKGWRNIGAVNGPRLAQFRSYVLRRPHDSLATLISDDLRFRDTKRTDDA
ncbi:MAG: DUF1570 domain-containing protein, partial [Planctomycetota bacterium]